MAEREIEVRCPCCESTLVVDVRTRAVLRHAPKQQIDETGKLVLDPSRWEAAKARVSGRKGGAGDAFDAALAKEQGRPKDLDDLFDKARRKSDQRRSETEDDTSSGSPEAPKSD